MKALGSLTRVLAPDPLPRGTCPAEDLAWENRVQRERRMVDFRDQKLASEIHRALFIWAEVNSAFMLGQKQVRSLEK